MRATQLVLSDDLKVKSIHGGEYAIGKRKARRPVVTKRPMHLVMRSSLATGRHSFLQKLHARFIQHLVQTLAWSNRDESRRRQEGRSVRRKILGSSAVHAHRGMGESLSIRETVRHSKHVGGARPDSVSTASIERSTTVLARTSGAARAQNKFSALFTFPIM